VLARSQEELREVGPPGRHQVTLESFLWRLDLLQGRSHYLWHSCATPLLSKPLHTSSSCGEKPMVMGVPLRALVLLMIRKTDSRGKQPPNTNPLASLLRGLGSYTVRRLVSSLYRRSTG
jgi:hypothetical protein